MKHRPKLYNFDENIIINVQKKVKDITEFKHQPIKNELIQEIPKQVINSSNFILTSNITPPTFQEDINDSYKNLWIAKTDDADIYNLYDNYNILTSNKIGVALVPTLQDSIKLRNTFKDKNLTFTIKYKCLFNEKFNKYHPIEQLS